MKCNDCIVVRDMKKAQASGAAVGEGSAFGAKHPAKIEKGNPKE